MTSRHHLSPPIHLVLLTIVAAMCAIACWPSPQSEDRIDDAPLATTAKPPAVIHPTAVLPDGFVVTLELAITPDERAQGLMFRPILPEDRGMLLVFSEEGLPNIWMMNTLVSLDIVYLDRSGTVVDLVVDAQPCAGEPCPRFSPKQVAQVVLEIPAGGAGRHGIEVGSTLEFSDVPGFPVID